MLWSLLKEKQINFLDAHKHGVMIILSSPSGAGKTLVRLLSEKKILKSQFLTLQENPDSEIQDKDYYFVNEKEFKNLIQEEEFRVWKVFNNFYGTTKTPVIDKLSKENVLFDIDWQGADQIKNKKLNYKLNFFYFTTE